MYFKNQTDCSFCIATTNKQLKLSESEVTHITPPASIMHAFY